MVSVLICTYNSASVLPACLRSLAQQDYSPVEIVIVDNASADDTPRLLESHRESCNILLNKENVGFSAAMNQAIRAAKGEWLLTLNPDVVLASTFISQLVQIAENHPDVGVICGKLLRWKPGKNPELTTEVDSTGMYFVPSLRHFDRGSNEIDTGQYEVTQYVFGATGAASLIRRRMVEDVSMDGEFYDEDFFAYREDADLAWRAQLLGWKCLYVPAAIGWHVRRVTPERRRELPFLINWHSIKNRFIMRMKNLAPSSYLRLFLPITARDCLILGYCLLVDRRMLYALGWVWSNRRRILVKRKMIQARRRIAEREILRWFSDRPTAFAFGSGVGGVPPEVANCSPAGPASRIHNAISRN